MKLRKNKESTTALLPTRNVPVCWWQVSGLISGCLPVYRLPMFYTVAVDTLFLYTVAGAALGLNNVLPTSL